MAPYQAPKVRSWEYENRSARRQRQMAQFQQLTDEVRPHIATGDYATAQAIIAQRVPDAVQPKKATPSGGGGLLGKVRDIGGDILGAGKDAGSAALTALDAPRKYVGQPVFSVLSGTTGNETKIDPRTGETYRDAPSFADVGRGLKEAFTRSPGATYREARQASDERLRDPGLNAFSRTLMTGAADPLNFAGPGLVKRGVSLLPAAAQASKLTRVGAALVENPGRASAGAIAGSAVGAGSAEKAGLGEKGQIAAALAGGVVGGGLAGSRQGPRIAGQALEELSQQVSPAAMTKTLPPGVSLFHGSPVPLEGDNLRPSAHGDIGPGAYLTTKPETASNYAWGATSLGARYVEDHAGANVSRWTTDTKLKLLRADKQVTTAEAKRIDAAYEAVTGQTAPQNAPWRIYAHGDAVIDYLDSVAPDFVEYAPGSGGAGAFVQSVLERAGFDGTYQQREGMTNPEWGRPFNEGAKSDEAAVFYPEDLRPTIGGGAVGLPPVLTARDEILNLPGLAPKPLGTGDKVMNQIKRTVGFGIEEDPVATPAMRERERLRPVVESQAARLGQVATDTVRNAFTFDEKGRILDFGDVKPTIQDLAARYLDFEPRMTTQQIDAMEALRREVEPYAAKLAEVGVELHQRGDVMEGGFYLPRGRADIEGADAPVKAGGRGRPGGKKGFERGATFESMQQGIDAGYEYAPFGEAMQAYARDAGNRAVDQHVASYFKTLTDEDGNLIAQTSADRVPVALRAQWEDTAARVAKVRGRLNTAMKRAKLAAGEADELDRALEEISPRVPEDAGKLAGIGRALDREGQRATDMQADKPQRVMTGGGPVRLDMPADAGDVTTGVAIEKVVSRLEQFVPPDVDRIATLEAAIRRSGRRLDTLLTRGGTYADEAQRLKAELDAAQAVLDDLRPQWQAAIEKSRQTPRGQGAINFAQLSGYSFPEAIANAANKYIDAEGPPRGRGATTVATITALNTLLRGVRATADVSFMGIQGLLGASRDPVGYGKALAIAWKAAADPDALGEYLRQYDARAMKSGRLTSKEWAKDGLHIGGSDTEFAVGRGLSGKLGALGTGDTPGVKLNPFRGSNRMFGYFGDVLRLELADTSATLWSRMGADINDARVRQQVAEAANLGTGWSRNTFGGDVGQLGMFAPRFFQSQLELITKAVTDGSVTGHEARMMLTSMLGSAIGLTVLANELSPDGMKPEEYLNPIGGKGGLNPNFLRFRAGGQDISLLGPWDSLGRAMTAAAQGDPQYMLRSKSSPAVGLAWDLLSGETFMGDEASLTNPGYLARSVLPFSLSGLGTEAPLGTAIGTTGLKASDLSPTERLDQVAATFVDPETGKVNAKPFYESSPATKKAIKEAHPDLWERAVEKGSRQRQQYEEAKTLARQQQEGDDSLLLAGKLTLQQWQDRQTNRGQQLVGQQQAIYRDAKGKVQTGDSVLDEFHRRIDASSEANNGQPLWDEVYAWVDALPEAQRTHIETNSGLNRTPLGKLSKKVSSDYYSIPQYKGYSADEGVAINALLDQVSGLAGRGADDTRRLRVLRKLVADGTIDEKIAGGARRRILGLATESRAREIYRKQHPESALLTRQGPLTPADVAAIQKALAS